MRRVKHREENSPSTRRGPGGRTSPGDVIEVSDEIAQKLLSKPYFVAVSDADVEGDKQPTNEESEDEGTSESEADVDDGFDVDGWLGQDYDDRADRVRAGEVDDHLDEIDEIETSGTVRDAIGERRAELEA